MDDSDKADGSVIASNFFFCPCCIASHIYISLFCPFCIASNIYIVPYYNWQFIKFYCILCNKMFYIVLHCIKCFLSWQSRHGGPLYQTYLYHTVLHGIKRIQRARCTMFHCIKYILLQSNTFHQIFLPQARCSVGILYCIKCICTTL